MSDPWIPVSNTAASWTTATSAILVSEDFLVTFTTEDGLYNFGIEGYLADTWISANAASLITEDMLVMITTEDGLNIGVEGYQQTIWTPVN